MSRSKSFPAVRRLRSIGIAAALSLATLPAAAEPAATSAPAPSVAVPPGDTPQPKHWYGWQILIPGLASHAVFGAGVAFGLASENWFAMYTMIGIGGAGHLFSGPIVHLVHHSPAKAAASFALAAVPPALSVGLMLSSWAFTDGGGEGLVTAGLTLLPIGMVTGLLVDSFVLAKEPVAPSVNRNASVTDLSVGPLFLGPIRDQRPIGFGFSGRF